MEKFGKWRDDRTGLAPFNPTKCKDRSGVGTVLLWTVGLVLFPIRLVAILLCIALLVFFSFVGLWLALLSGALERRFRLWVCSPVLRTMLLFLGFYWVDTPVVFTSQMKRSEREKSRQLPVESGDVIVANHVSYVDVLWLAYRYAPVFTAVPNEWKGKEGEDEGLLIPRSMIGALFDVAFQRRHTVDAATPTETILREAREKGHGPVVVFPEGTTSNGTALLQCVPAFRNTRTPSKAHVVGFKYEAVGFSPAFSCGGVFSHVCQLLLQPVNSMHVVSLASVQTPSMEELSNVELVEQILAKLLRLKVTDLTSGDKQDFLEYYSAIASGREYKAE